MDNCKTFSLYVKEKEIKDFSKEDELLYFKSFKHQMFNSKIRCKKCKNTLESIIFKNKVGCPSCYDMILKRVLDGKFLPSIVDSDIAKFFLSITKDYRYKGKRPEYVKKYFDNEIKINDLKKELKYCIEIEDYGKCEVLKYTIDDMELKQSEFRRKING